MKDLLYTVIKDTKDWENFTISESRDSETETKMTALVTYGYGADHGHIELSIDECKSTVEFLNKIIKKSGE